MSQPTAKRVKGTRRRRYRRERRREGAGPAPQAPRQWPVSSASSRRCMGRCADGDAADRLLAGIRLTSAPPQYNEEQRRLSLIVRLFGRGLAGPEGGVRDEHALAGLVDHELAVR